MSSVICNMWFLCGEDTNWGLYLALSGSHLGDMDSDAAILTATEAEGLQ